MIEKTASELYTRRFKETLESKISPRGARRVVVGIFSTFWCFYCSLTNFYFVAGKQSFVNVAKAICGMNLVEFGIIFVFNYCRVQTCIHFEVKSEEESRKKQN